MSKVKTYEKEVAGKKLWVEIGRLAGQANGSCVVRYGETTVLVTATMSAYPKTANYFPLAVDYEEKYYAAGKIKGSRWIKRETRPSEEAILTGRLIDRALRPRFDQRMRHEVQIVPTVLTFDGINDPDVPALFGASLALMISDIPFAGPVAGMRVGRIKGQLVFNPSYQERMESDFDVFVGGTENKVNMLEAGLKIVPEEEVVKAVDQAFDFIRVLTDFQKEILKDFSVKKHQVEVRDFDPALVKMVHDFISPKLEKVLYTPHKLEYVEGLNRTSEELKNYLQEQFTDHPELAKKLEEANQLFEKEIDRIVHTNILMEEKRPDGRKIDEIRELSAETAILPHSHGSGLFNRGTTQVLSVLTLASPGMEQWVETMEIELSKKRFMHHYIFPPFSVGEVGRIGFAGRREIGHGALAERALEPIVPLKENFPYTIRVVSETLSSNGSSSMASVCGSSLALMDGGVPITSPVAGIAMGLMFDQELQELSDKNQEPKYKILTDIQGPEDHHGDMDLKVAGTANGLTALQMDVKIEGITSEILSQALRQARKARLEILKVLTGVIAQPRKELSPFAPRILSLKINPEKIRVLIGPQGKTIHEIIDQTGVEIDVEDDGSVFVTADSQEAIQRAETMIKNITYEEKPGDQFEGKVTRLLDFGAFVEYLPGREGLVHVSEISKERTNHPADVLKVGQKVRVRVKNIDDYGRINLTMK